MAIDVVVVFFLWDVSTTPFIFKGGDVTRKITESVII
jgi:hypothetical protein